MRYEVIVLRANHCSACPVCLHGCLISCKLYMHIALASNVIVAVSWIRLHIGITVSELSSRQ